MNAKYAIIIPDGAADLPLFEFDGATPLERARMPHLDRLAREGELGLVNLAPAGFDPGSDIGHLSLLGYDPARSYTGRAPIEAASLGVPMEPGDLALRCNLVTIEGGVMRCYSAGHISTTEARELIAALSRELDADMELTPGVSYRHILRIKKGGAAAPTRTPPHDLTGQAVIGHELQGPHAARLSALEARSRAVFAAHPVNRARHAPDRPPATQIWLWGGGRALVLPSFQARTGLRGAVIAAVDLVRGLGRAAAMTLITVPGATGFLDTDYEGKGRALCRALDDHDLVLCHVEAPDEAAHGGMAAAKVQALEAIDRHIIAPAREHLARHPHPAAILVAPDHITGTQSRTHERGPVPFMIWRNQRPTSAEIPRRFTERHAAAAGLLLDEGSRLIDRLIEIG